MALKPYIRQTETTSEDVRDSDNHYAGSGIEMSWSIESNIRPGTKLDTPFALFSILSRMTYNRQIGVLVQRELEESKSKWITARTSP